MRKILYILLYLFSVTCGAAQEVDYILIESKATHRLIPLTNPDLPTHALNFSTAGLHPDIDGLPIVKKCPEVRSQIARGKLMSFGEIQYLPFNPKMPVVVWRGPQHVKKEKKYPDDVFDEEDAFDDESPPVPQSSWFFAVF